MINKKLKIKTGLQNRLKDVCKQLTQRQRKVTVLALLIVFAVLVAISIMDTFRSCSQPLEYGRISPLQTLGTNHKDTTTLKNINDGTE